MPLLTMGEPGQIFFDQNIRMQHGFHTTDICKLKCTMN